MDEFVISESGNWNVAARFAYVKIMIPQEKCEYYEDMAKFGYETVFDELMNYGRIPDDIVRIIGLKRLVDELIKLINNAKFAMKRPNTKKTIEEQEEKLKVLKGFIPKTYKTTYNQVQKIKSTTIVPEFFDNILERVIQIKADINEPLNQNHLIFTDREEFDPKAFKDRIKDRMRNKG